MREQRLILSPDLVTVLRDPGDRVLLDVGESRRLRLVLRLRPGDQVIAADGKGAEADARIATIRKDDGRVEIEMRGPWRERRLVGPIITIASSWPKGKRASYLVEKCTEAGAHRIIPVEFRRSVARPADGSAGMARWRGIAESAARQSGRADVPEISPPVSFHDLVAEAAAFEYRFAAMAPSERSFDIFAAGSGGETAVDGPKLPRIEEGKKALCLIGPEGGFADEEKRVALAAGFLPLNLGPFVLRIETAAAIACAVLMLTADK